MSKKEYMPVAIDLVIVAQDVVTASGLVGVQWSEGWGDAYEGWGDAFEG